MKKLCIGSVGVSDNLRIPVAGENLITIEMYDKHHRDFFKTLEPSDLENGGSERTEYDEKYLVDIFRNAIRSLDYPLRSRGEILIVNDNSEIEQTIKWQIQKFTGWKSFFQYAFGLRKNFWKIRYEISED